MTALGAVLSTDHVPVGTGAASLIPVWNGAAWVLTDINAPTVAKSRTDIRDEGLSLLGQTFELQSVQASLAYTSQRCYWGLIGLKKGDPVGGIALNLNVAGAGTDPTGAYVYIYTTAFVQLGVSTNQAAHAGFKTVGTQRIPLSGTYTATATGVYLVGFLINGTFGTTQPTFTKGPGGYANLHSGIGAYPGRFYFQDTQATPPTPGTGTVTALSPWMSAVI